MKNNNFPYGCLIDIKDLKDGNYKLVLEIEDANKQYNCIKNFKSGQHDYIT